MLDYLFSFSNEQYTWAEKNKARERENEFLNLECDLKSHLIAEIGYKKQMEKLLKASLKKKLETFSVKSKVEQEEAKSKRKKKKKKSKEENESQRQ